MREHSVEHPDKINRTVIIPVEESVNLHKWTCTGCGKIEYREDNLPPLGFHINVLKIRETQTTQIATRSTQWYHDRECLTKRLPYYAFSRDPEVEI